jgi:hypothetical protein
MGRRRQEFNTKADPAMSAADNDNTQHRGRPLAPAAQRALAEAEERRKARTPTEMPKEIGGRDGADPSRFGDWEINGRAIDF